MVTMTYSNLSAEGLRKAMKNKKYGRYVLLYLYDGYNEMSDDSATHRLFANYGKKINNRLGRDFTLLTIYDKEVLEKWGCFMGEDVLKKQFTYQESMTSEKNHYVLMKDLAIEYGIEHFPALVLIDTEVDAHGREQYIIKEYRHWQYDTIYEHIEHTINAIRDHYGDFERIQAECRGYASSTQKKLIESLYEKSSLKEIIDDYIKKAHRKKKSLCAEIHIGDRMLRRYRNECENGVEYPLPRDTAIAIAFALKLTPEEADRMFDAAAVKPIPRLGTEGRDGVIRKGLRNGLTLAEVNQQLKDYKQMPVGS